MINLIPRLAIAGCAAIIPITLYVNFTSGTKNTSAYALLESRLRSIEEVSTAQVNTFIQVTKRDEQKLGQLSVGSTEVYYNANVVIKAGIKKAVVEMQGDRPVIVADPPVITNAYLDPKTSGLVTEKKSWIAPDTGTALTEQAQKEAVSQAVAQACNAGILDKANENAKAFFNKIAPGAEVRLSEPAKCGEE